MATSVHGTLFVWLREACNLPDALGTACCWRQRKNTVDAFVTLEMCQSKVLRSAVVFDSTNPVWAEHFVVDVAHDTDEAIFYINDTLNGFEYRRIGMTKISAQEIVTKRVVEGWFPVEGYATQDECTQLHVKIEFLPAAEAAKHDCVPNAYFDLCEGNGVTLYQDAYCPVNDLFSEVPTANSQPYEPQSLWHDVSEAINKAKKFIYLTDWKFAHHIRLVRAEEGGETVGALLKRKAEEGVIVLLLIWDSRFSGTDDSETLEYFRESKVVAVRVLRQKEGSNLIENEVAQNIYSHHQKTIIVDTGMAAGKNSVIAFVGGLDLTSGRYDSYHHPLFTTDMQQYADDFYQNCAEVDKSCGPRLPWHDIHCRLCGPAAIDVMKNFEERWRKQVADKVYLLYDITSNGLAVDMATHVSDWHVQILRSINVDSAAFEQARMARLSSKRGRKTDNSISRGYVLLVRKAEKFIYIENQYFFGSSYAWPTHKTDKCRHVLPMEVVHKIGAKIMAGERFAVYIVVPMRPDGMPESPDVHDMLHHQHLTMQTMYKRIATYIREANSHSHPTDYLNFYFLAKREPDPRGSVLSANDWALGNKARLKKNRRFMIYVHSKMMIVDDSYVVVGSANANQRSLGGNRDTEIMMFGYQLSQKIREGQLLVGDVHSFRMALWAEHTGHVWPESLEPDSLQCLHKVNDLAEANLQTFCDEHVNSLTGHLVKYPINVSIHGDVIARFSTFPDSSVPVLGNKNIALPLKLTT